MKSIEQKRQMAEKTWLGYFNQTLYEQGIITETDRNRLALRIDNRKPSTRIPSQQVEPQEIQEQEFEIKMGM